MVNHTINPGRAKSFADEDRRGDPGDPNEQTLGVDKVKQGPIEVSPQSRAQSGDRRTQHGENATEAPQTEAPQQDAGQAKPGGLKGFISEAMQVRNELLAEGQGKSQSPSGMQQQPAGQGRAMQQNGGGDLSAALSAARDIGSTLKQAGLSGQAPPASLPAHMSAEKQMAKSEPAPPGPGGGRR